VIANAISAAAAPVGIDTIALQNTLAVGYHTLADQFSTMEENITNGYAEAAKAHLGSYERPWNETQLYSFGTPTCII
jgi:hypothetical protein